jgi:hypothetical protein
VNASLLHDTGGAFTTAQLRLAHQADPGRISYAAFGSSTDPPPAVTLATLTDYPHPTALDLFFVR